MSSVFNNHQIYFSFISLNLIVFSESATDKAESATDKAESQSS